MKSILKLSVLCLYFFVPAVKKSLLILIIWFHAVSVLQAEPLLRTEIRNPVHRKAVCNDGSPGVYYFRSGSGTGSRRWMIYLQCSPHAICDAGYCEGSSLNTPPVFEYLQEGLLSARSCQNPDFYNANQAAIINCSGDMWSGNNTLLSGAGPIEFRGRNIVRAVIQDLIDKPGSTLNEPGAEVLLWGAGCGGIGVMTHLDWLAEKLPNATVRGLNDTGWMLRTKCCVALDYASARKGLKIAVKTWKSEVNKTCALANPTDPSICLFPSVYQYLKTPLFVQYSQWDWHWVSANSSPETNQFAKDVRRSLAPVAAAFSSQYPISVLAYHREFNSIEVNGFTMADLLGNWFFDRAGPVKAISTIPNSTIPVKCGPLGDEGNIQ